MSPIWRSTSRLALAAALTVPLLAACNGSSNNDDQPPTASTPYPVRVGEVGPVAADNPRQQPFGCQTFATALGQPLVDNQEGIGYPVTEEGGAAPADHGAINDADIIGYSADCGAPTMVQYWYRSTAGGSL